MGRSVRINGRDDRLLPFRYTDDTGSLLYLKYPVPAKAKVATWGGGMPPEQEGYSLPLVRFTGTSGLQRKDYCGDPANPECLVQEPSHQRRIRGSEEFPKN